MYTPSLPPCNQRKMRSNTKNCYKHKRLLQRHRPLRPMITQRFWLEVSALMVPISLSTTNTAALTGKPQKRRRKRLLLRPLLLQHWASLLLIRRHPNQTSYRFLDPRVFNSGTLNILA